MALTLNDQQEADLLVLLGLPKAGPGDTDVELVVDAITDLHKQVQELDPAKPATVRSAAARAGLDVIDKPTLESLRRDAASGRQAAAAAAKAKVDGVVADAVNKGKITASRSKHWVSLIEADPGMAEVLAAVPDETAVPLSEAGHAADVTHAAEPDGGTWFY